MTQNCPQCKEAMNVGFEIDEFLKTCCFALHNWDEQNIAFEAVNGKNFSCFKCRNSPQTISERCAEVRKEKKSSE